VKRFHGQISSSRWQRGGFWQHLDVDATAVVFWTWLGGDVRLDRETVDRVEFERVHLPPFLWWVTNVRFHQTDDQWSDRFVAFRPNRLRHELTHLGWPVKAAPPLGYRRLFAERRTTA
jgi:hypothetical protein